MRTSTLLLQKTRAPTTLKVSSIIRVQIKNIVMEEKSPVVEESSTAETTNHQPPPLQQVLSSCTRIQTYSSEGVRNWNDLVRLADTVSPMMDIEPKVWTAVK